MLGPCDNPARATVVPFWRKTILHVEGVCSRVTGSAGVFHAIVVYKVSDLSRKFGNFDPNTDDFQNGFERGAFGVFLISL